MQPKKERETLWNNPMVTAAKNAMSPEDIEKYNKLGESMFKDIDFVKAEVAGESSGSFPEYVKDAIAYIYESLKSGLHPSMLSKEEITVLENFDGEEWYKKWGYEKGDLSDIVTIVKKDD